MKKIIGIIGFIGSGKDSIGDHLVEKHGFQKDSLSSPLKDSISSIFGWDRIMLDGNTHDSRLLRDVPDEWWEKELDWSNNTLSKYFLRFTPRTCLQLFGTNLLRDNFDPNIWILSLKNRLEKHNQDTVITDCRFPNELKIINELGGITMRVKRGDDPPWVDYIQNKKWINDNDKSKYMLDLGIHISEYSSLDWKENIRITNNTNLSDLFDQVDYSLKDFI